MEPAAEVPSAPSPAAARQRVVVANPAGGGVLLWVGRLYLFLALIIVASAVVATLGAYRYFAVSTPPAPDLSSYTRVAPAVTRVYAADGTKLGEFAEEFREIVPYEQIPPQLIDAVVAIEDHQFFEHGGIYWKGIARAAWRNVTAGDFAQGGSTITQQVAKQFLTCLLYTSRCV